jgi:hypothetical protein
MDNRTTNRTLMESITKQLVNESEGDYKQYIEIADDVIKNLNRLDYEFAYDDQTRDDEKIRNLIIKCLDNIEAARKIMKKNR